MRTIAFAAMMLVALSGCSREQPAIRVGDRKISKAELKAVLLPLGSDSAAIRTAVDNLVSRELILCDASSRGLDTMRTTLERLYDRRRERLQSAYLRYKLGLVTVPEDSVTSFYQSTGTMVCFTVMNVADSALAESLRTAVLAGADMGYLVNRFSTLETDAENLGRVGPEDLMRLSSADRQLVPGLARGEVSRVAGFPSGWRFMRIDTLYTVDRPPFAEARQGIYDFIWAHRSEEYKKTLDDSLRSAWSLQIADGTPALISSHASDPAGDFSPYSPGEDSATAYSWRGGRRTIGFLSRNIRDIPRFMPKDATDPVWVEGYCRILGLYDIMAARAVELGLDTLPDVAAGIRASCDDVILDAWRSAVLEPRLAVSDSEIAAAWEENRSMLVVPEKRRFEGVAAVGAGQEDLLRSLLASGRDPLASRREFTPLSALLAPGESLLTKPLSSSDLPARVSDRFFALAPGEAAVCTLQGGSLVYLRLSEIIPSREATLDESRESLSSLLTSQKEGSALRGLVDSLRSAYPCEVDEEFVSRFLTDPGVEPVTPVRSSR